MFRVAMIFVVIPGLFSVGLLLASGATIHGRSVPIDSSMAVDGRGSHTSVAKTVNCDYDTIVGDFDGDGRSDIFWYAKNRADDDFIWFFNATRGSHTSIAKTVNGDYDTMVVST